MIGLSHSALSFCSTHGFGKNIHIGKDVLLGMFCITLLSFLLYSVKSTQWENALKIEVLSTVSVEIF